MTSNAILLIAAIASGMLTIYILNSLVNLRIKGKISEKLNPLSVDILKAVLFLCGGLLLSEIANSYQTLRKILATSHSGNDLLVNEIMYYSLFLGIILLTLVIIIWFAAIMVNVATKGKSVFIEAANDNLNVVYIWCGIVLALTLAAKAELSFLFETFIQYPLMPIYH